MKTCHLDDKSLNVVYHHHGKVLSRPFLDKIQNSTIQYYEVIGGMGFDLGN